jgi:hypothetical protein
MKKILGGGRFGGGGDDSRGQMEVKKGNCRVEKCKGKGQCQIVTFGHGTTMSLEVHCKKSDDSYWARRELGSGGLNAERMGFNW